MVMPVMPVSRVCNNALSGCLVLQGLDDARNIEVGEDPGLLLEFDSRTGR